MTWQIAAGSTDVTINVFVKNKTLNDGSGLTGLAFNTGSLTCYYIRPGANATVLNLVTQTVTGVHADGGFVEIDATNMPGIYRLDLSDAVVASGVGPVTIMLQGAANMAPAAIEIQLDLVDDIWDETISGASHNAANSSGKLLRQAGQQVIREDTAQGPGTGTNQIQLDTGASSVDGAYDPAGIFILSGTGADQTRLILEYDGTTKIATLDRDWKVNPDATSEFIIFPDAGRGHVNEGLARGGTTATITLNTLGSSISGVYIGQTVFISSGTGADQAKTITEYNGTTKIAVVSSAWNTTPDTTSGYSILPRSHGLFQGYEFGAIWIDTVNGAAGTVNFENGTPENPSSNLADATTLATSLGLARFQIAPNSTLTLAQSYDNFIFDGHNWTLALAGQSISGCHFFDCSVSGIGTGSDCEFHESVISANGTLTIDDGDFFECTLSGSIVLNAANTFCFNQCFSGVAGTGTPDIDLGAAVGNTNLNLRHYSGGIEIKNMGATGTDNMSLEGFGQLVINANCTGGTIAIRGLFTVTDNAGGVVTLSDDARIDTTQINNQIWSEIMSELTSVSDVPAAPTLAQALMLTYMRERNDYQTTTSERRILNDAGVEVLDAPMSDNGAVFSQGKLTDA